MTTGFQEQDACPVTWPNTNCGAGVRNVANGLYPGVQTAPLWTLQQWGSASSLAGGPGASYGDGLVWADANKHIATFPGGIFEMGVNGLNDWGGVYPQNQPLRQGWPSFTLGFNISNPGNVAGALSLAAISSLTFQMDARLAMEDPHRGAGFDPSRNVVIFVTYISLQNLNAASPGFGQFVWLGVPIYNDLHSTEPSYINGDSYGDGLGTGMLIYNPGSATYTNQSLWSLGWVHFQADLVPIARAALSRGLGAGLLSDPNSANYYFSGVNIGYEITGFNETTIQFKGLSMKAKQ